MNPFAIVERTCATFVEAAFARVFPSDVAPSQIARRLVATMQSQPADTFLVRLHPRDLANLGAHRAFLESQWSELLERTAVESGTVPARPLRVVLAEDDALVAGTLAIDAAADEEEEAAARGYALRIAKGLPLDAVFHIEREIVIGRGGEVDVDVPDARVSRRHARIFLDGPGVAIEDLDSTNGTTVNGIPILDPRRLSAGDRIAIGDTELCIEVAQ